MHPQTLYRQLCWVVLTLLVVGLTMLFSSSGVLGLQRHGSEFYFITRQALCALLGVGLAVGLSFIKPTHWRKVAFPLLFVQILLVAATYIPSISQTVHGATRWIYFSGIRFQPSELAKISVAVYTAYLLWLWQKNCLPIKWAGILSLPVGLLLILIFKQPDLGSTVLLSSMIIGTLFMAGTRPAYLFSALGVGGALFGISLWSSAYRQRRLLAFLNPWADPKGSGFQSIQSFLSIRSGEIWGNGIGNGNSKLFYLPEVHTDFIFALVGEELGFVGAVALLGLFTYFGYLLFKVVRIAPCSFTRFLSFALALSFVLQIAVNLGGVTGLIPVKGLPLPFFSWGRSALLINLSMVGILLSVVRAAIPEKEAPPANPITTPPPRLTKSFSV